MQNMFKRTSYSVVGAAVLIASSPAFAFVQSAHTDIPFSPRGVTKPCPAGSIISPASGQCVKLYQGSPVQTGNGIAGAASGSSGSSVAKCFAMIRGADGRITPVCNNL